MTRSKEVRDKYFGWNYELTDTPDCGYQQHVAKTSCGFLPLFDGSGCLQSVRELKRIHDTGDFILCDEYGTTYTWEEFDKRVLQFNGGVRGKIPTTLIENDSSSMFYDPYMPDHTPVSHLEYGHGMYDDEYFVDEDRFEFSKRTFR